MKNLLNVIVIGLFAVLLSGCDYKEKVEGAPKVATVTANGKASLLNGRFSFVVPPHLTDKGGELAGQTNDMIVYSDDSGRQNLVALATSADDTNLEVLTAALENQYHSRDANAKTVIKEPFMIGIHQAWRLDIVSNVKGQQAYNSILLVILGADLVTLQMSFPDDNSVKPDAIIQQVINSIEIS